MTERNVTVRIPQTIFDTIKKRVEGSNGEFNTVEDYVNFVLDQVASEDLLEQTGISREDDEDFKKRLKGLGYI